MRWVDICTWPCVDALLQADLQGLCAHASSVKSWQWGAEGRPRLVINGLQIYNYACQANLIHCQFYEWSFTESKINLLFWVSSTSTFTVQPQSWIVWQRSCSPQGRTVTAWAFLQNVYESFKGWQVVFPCCLLGSDSSYRPVAKRNDILDA